jgi:hypothetical protein
MVMPFAYAIPFTETISGALIFLGLFTRIGLTLSGLLLIGLTFGVVMLGQTRARQSSPARSRNQSGKAQLAPTNQSLTY